MSISFTPSALDSLFKADPERFIATHDISSFGIAYVYQEGDLVKQIGTAVEANARDVKIISQRGVPVGPRGGWRALREIVLVDPDEKARMRVEGGEWKLECDSLGGSVRAAKQADAIIIARQTAQGRVPTQVHDQNLPAEDESDGEESD